MSTPTTESVYVGDPEALRQAAIVQLRKTVSYTHLTLPTIYSV